MFNTETKRFLGSFVGHQNWVKAGVFSPDSRLIASGSDDKTVRVWDINKGKEITMFYDHVSSVNGVQFHPNGTCIATCGADSKIKVFDLRANRLIQH